MLSEYQIVFKYKNQGYKVLGNLVVFYHNRLICTAIGNSGRSLRQGYGIIKLLLKGVSDGEIKTKKLHPEFKFEVVLEALSGQNSQAELCRKHNLSDVQLSMWKRQLLENATSFFEPIDKQTNASQQRITQLERLVGRLTLELDIKESFNLLVELTSAKNEKLSKLCEYLDQTHQKILLFLQVAFSNGF